jgi:hypothetical protein
MISRISHLASRHLQRFTLSRYLSSTTKLTDNKEFTTTLLLPKTSFVLRPNPKQIDNFYRKLTCDDLYRWQVSDLACILLLKVNRLNSGTMQRVLYSFCMMDHLTPMEICTWVPQTSSTPVKKKLITF